MNLADILRHTVFDMLQTMLLSDVENSFVIVGPGEFHYSPAYNKDFACLAGTHSISRDKLPESFFDAPWEIVHIKNDDEFLDLYNSVVLNAKDIDHEVVS
jgi:hypothetical protein